MKIFLAILAIAVGIGVAVLAYQTVLDLRIGYLNYQNLSALAKTKAETKNSYDALIKDQERRQKIVLHSLPEAGLPDVKARGKQVVRLVFVIQSDATKEDIRDLYQRLSKPCLVDPCEDFSSVFYISSFYRNEAKKFNVTDFSTSFILNGPVIMPELEKVGDMANIWQKDPFGVANLEDQFEKLLAQNKIPATKEDLVVFIYFDNSISPKTERFYDGTHFRSFTDQEKRRAYVNLYDFSPAFAPRATEIIAHELLHIFGASDKYAENPVDGICSAKGHGLITTNPIYSQTTADIMCGYVETSKKQFKKANFTDGNLVINSLTAKEIGW